MCLLLNEKCPDFTAETQNDPVRLYEYTQGSLFVIFCHPGLFTPVCTSEIVEIHKCIQKFIDRNVKVLVMSFGNKEESKEWVTDICSLIGGGISDISIPLICDKSRDIAVQLGMIKLEDKTKTGLAFTARHVMICDKDKNILAYIVYPATSGRNIDEVIRLIDTLLVKEKTGCSCPVNWNPGDDLLVPNPPPAGSEQYVKDLKLVVLPSGKGYMQYGKPIGN